MNATTPVELIPRTVLFGNPVKAGAQVSPDGTRMAYLAPVNNVLNVWVGTIGSADYQPVTRDEDRGIRQYHWAYDNKHILYIQDRGGNENWRLYATNLDTRETRDLTPFENVHAQVIALDKHFPNELLVALNRDDPRLHDVYHLDLLSGELTQIAKNPGNVAGWQQDTNLKIRAALAMAPDGSRSVLIRQSEHDVWETLLAWDTDDSQNSYPVSFSKDGQSLYLIDSRAVNAGRLVKMDIHSGALTVIAEDHQYDVSSVFVDPDSYEIQAVAFDKERSAWVVLDESIKLDFDTIQDIAPGDFAVVSRDDANTTWIVQFTRDDGPVSYYAYERKSRAVTFLFDNQPDLNHYTLAQMQPISFTSRDGLPLHGYLTLPPGKAATHLPLVLNVHGGPQARDRWGYNPEAQWFANRGYACLQVNYRGSTGYGKDFLNAGNREWGGKMHDDLVDAVAWVVDKGIADPHKLAIYGGSYGGYAALVGATFTPDLFCCAVDIVGPSNLVTLLQSVPPYWSTMLAMLYRRVGNPESEPEFLRARSPLFKVDQIKIPLLIAQGANDPRVKQAESEQIVAALRSRDIDYQYLLYEDEGHGFAKPENRLTFYAAAEKFLAKHLGGRFEE